MTGHEYLADVLRQQTLADTELAPLRAARDEIEALLKSHLGWSPRFYYAGSYAKHTIVRINYDLDLVVYFDSQRFPTLREMYHSVYRTLADRYGSHVVQKTVSIQISYSSGFHIDVVPGRLISSFGKDANLYRTDTETSLRTNIETQVGHVRESGQTDVMRLMKIWRERHSLNFKSFALELIVLRALSGSFERGYDDKVLAILRFVRDRVLDIPLIDPANTNNNLADSIPRTQKEVMRRQAIESLGKQYWREIIW